jgi:hypothetical protein
VILFHVIAHCPRYTVYQREQEKPDCEEASEKHDILETATSDSISRFKYKTKGRFSTLLILVH